MKICKKCGAQNQDVAVVCKSCGSTALREATQEELEEDTAAFVDEKKPYHIVPSFIFSFLAIAVASAKDLFTIDPEDEAFKHSNYYMQFVFVGIAIAIAILSAVCLRGVFKKKPIPLMTIFAIFLCIATFALLAFDCVLLAYIIPKL